MEFIFTKRLSDTEKQGLSPLFTLKLTAEDRKRSRYRWEIETGEILTLRLPRGTILQDKDFLSAENGEIIQIIAKPEPVLTLTSDDPLELIRVAYHLGNRHVSLEIHPNYLRLSPDPVLKTMIEQFNVILIEEIAPFQPEIGAYHSH
jgi:urease accessory protein